VPSASFILVNNLDLFVANLLTSDVLIGNNRGWTDAAGTHIPWDYVNNVEQVTVPKVLTPTTFSVHVRGTHIPQSGQTFALVVSGDFDLLPVSQCAGPILCPNGCGGPTRGKCNYLGMCECVQDYTGSDCSEVSTAMPLDDSNSHYYKTSGTVQREGWAYFHFDADSYHKDTGISIIMKRTSMVGDPDLYVREDQFPTLRDYLDKATGCDSCTNAADSVVTIPAEKMKVGRYRIGIQGYCCDPSSFELKVTPPVSGKPSPTNYSTGLIIGAIILCIVGAVFLYQWRKKRRMPQQGGYTLAGGPVNVSGRQYTQLNYSGPVVDAAGQQAQPTSVGQFHVALPLNMPADAAVPLTQAGSGLDVEPPRSGTHLPLPTDDPENSSNNRPNSGS
jgi:hypothetical protein